MSKCPECGSNEIDTFRMPTGPMWCRACDYRVEDKENFNPFLTEEVHDETILKEVN